MGIKDTLEFLAEMLVKFGVPGFTGGIITLYVKQKLVERKEKPKKQAIDAVVSMGEIYADVFSPLMELDEVSSVVFFVVENSGKILNPLSPIFITALAEQKDKHVKSLVDNIVKWRSDDHFNRVLADMCRLGVTTLETAILPHESKLYPIYQSSGITYNEKYLAGAAMDGTKLYYMSIYTTKPDEKFVAPHVRATIQFCVNEIQNIVLKYTDNK